MNPTPAASLTRRQLLNTIAATGLSLLMTAVAAKRLAEANKFAALPSSQSDLAAAKANFIVSF